MADSLSQEEIDSLLGALDTGEVDVEEMKKEESEQKIKLYDFERPMKFSKDQIRTFQMLNENFARSLSTYLSGRLRYYVDVNLGPIDQITYSEFLKSLSNPTFMTIFTGNSLSGSAILEVNLGVIFGMIDRILGGIGETVSKPRTLTEIELNIVRREAMRFLTLLRDAWVNVMEFVPEIENIESNPQFVQIAPQNEMTLLVTLEIVIGNVEGFLNVCFPSSVIEPFSENLTNQMWFASSMQKKQSELRPVIKRNLDRTPIELAVELGKTHLSLSDLLYLEVGDVIRLDRYKDEELDVCIGNKPRFKGTAGKKRGKKAIKITQLIKDDLEFETDIKDFAEDESEGEG
jgi:flagellar motor switch protein FliM